jgi:uncharacterized protein (DUF4213/DUF364 family)
MKIIDDLISACAHNDSAILDVRVGVSWTGVWGKYCGLAKTYGIPFVHGNYTRDMGHLTEKTSLELAEYSKSWNFIEASIGVAAINSMIKSDKAIEANAQEMVLRKGQGKRIAMTGFFPFIPQLKKVARELWIMELDQAHINPAQGVINDTAAEHIIPECDMVILTGSTLINKSMERLLSLARLAQAYTVVLGPSTPMSEILFDYGADMIAGAEVIQPESVLKKLSQSGGMLNTTVCPGEIVFKVLKK